MNKRKTQLALVLAPLALAFFAFSQPALAADYTGNCANVPASVSGNVDITESGACNITHPVAATGRIKITAGSTISTQDLSSFAEVDLQAPASSDITVTGAITTDSGFVNLFGKNITVTGTINPVNLGNILIRAQSNLVTGQIIGAPGSNIVCIPLMSAVNSGKVAAPDSGKWRQLAMSNCSLDEGWWSLRSFGFAH